MTPARRRVDTSGDATPSRPAGSGEPDATPSLAPVRIREVAEHAGVSVGTVSNTINHPERVRPALRERVLQAITTLGFVPNQHARVLTGATSNVIGLVVLDIASPFYMGVAHAVEQAARRSGQVVLLCDSEGDPRREQELLTMLSAQRVRGVILAPARGASAAAHYRAVHAELPMVLLDYPGSSGLCTITVDHEQGGRLAATMLLERGHERIGYIAGPRRLRQFEQRARGARAVLAEAGLDPDRAFIPVHTRGIGISDGESAARRLLAATEPDDWPTAIFCGNDMLAFGAYRALIAAGASVPGDIALVGYDDIEFAKDWVVPLSTVRQPIAELGIAAAHMLDQQTGAAHAHDHVELVLTPEVVPRSSSHPASGASMAASRSR
ncbi:LacI family DNA-binding transcriptional regulator [Microbacterium sp. GXS0129]|uniref:LacI family DNA-binding transcriptional regulator n=1 Tax=Microbacterium sp. GXS0129 TaxID=3377836 RepID=UPI00383BA332